MNLHATVGRVVGIINPDIPATLLRSTGYTTGGDGTQAGTYDTLSGMIQVQGLCGTDYQHINNMNQMSVLRSVWILGNWAGVIRTEEKGGDIMKFPRVPDGPVETWKVITVKEAWADWSSVIVCLQ